jgi:excinuclease ABC subunit C
MTSRKVKLLLEKAKALPVTPGCYLMLNKESEVIYVGKAKNLKSRVSSYFTESQKTPKTEILVSKIREFEFILAKTDAESYVLENNLIKKHAPKYNIRLKDDRTYPYVITNMKDDFPRLIYTRKPKRKKNQLMFGPYPHGTNISETLKTIIKSFALRDCSDSEFKQRKTPCLLYQIKQCSGPCVGKIEESKYKESLDMGLNILRNGRKAKQGINFLTKKMMAFSENEEYERAAYIRDQIKILSEFLEKNNSQNVENLEHDFLDVIAFYEGSDEIDITVYMIRSGNLLGHKNFHFPLSEMINDKKDEITSFLLQYYTNTQEELPKHIICELDQEQKAMVEYTFEHSLKVKVKIPKTIGKYSSLLESTLKHAEESQRIRHYYKNSVFIALNRLKELLKLKEIPRVIECFDVAIWQGKSPTASQVVYHDGKPDKRHYRYYHLEEREEGNNDFAMMQELFRRRLDNGNLPDIFLIDGGKGQISSVKKVLDELDIKIPLIGIAKARSGKGDAFWSQSVSKTEERLFLPNRINPITLGKSPSLMRLIVGLRDEAHRFSRVLHHKQEKKRTFKSWIDDVKGIGPKAKTKILKKLDLPVSTIARFSIDEIKKEFGLSQSQAKSIKDHFDDLKPKESV